MPGDSLDVRIADAGHEWLVTCEGDLDVSSACRFRESIESRLAWLPERVFLDLERIAFIDPEGIDAVMKIALTTRTNGIMLTVSANEWLRRILDSVGVGSLVTLRS